MVLYSMQAPLHALPDVDCTHTISCKVDTATADYKASLQYLAATPCCLLACAACSKHTGAVKAICKLTVCPLIAVWLVAMLVAAMLGSAISIVSIHFAARAGRIRGGGLSMYTELPGLGDVPALKMPLHHVEGL